MYKVSMTDGTTLDVPYDKAKKIADMLEGITQPEDSKQQAFMERVASVDMRPPKPLREKRAPAKVADPELAKIMKNKKLKGVEKARAVADYIKSRKPVGGVS